MKFNIVTIFPEMFNSYLNESILARAIKNKKINVKFFNPRDFSKDKHKKVDDKPYGGGPGMVMYAEPILKAVETALRNRKYKVESIKGKRLQPKTYNLKPKVIILSPSGKKFTNKIAKDWSKKFSDLIIISGRYEGIDSRVKKILKAEEISVGDYILTGGELGAMIIIDSVSRQIDGVLGDRESIEENRISTSEMYTRPEIIKHKDKSYKVPKVLLSGNHAEIEKWKQKSIKR
ncbi:MAG: tRNA (guanosine(37)-N1)-methyltransferase TrmD [Candidatus Paceibacterota bacterium]|jgi:tRNA (guanine37-N1)-methyltransferase